MEGSQKLELSNADVLVHSPHSLWGIVVSPHGLHSELPGNWPFHPGCLAVFPIPTNLSSLADVQSCLIQTPHNGPFLHPSQVSFEETPQNDAELGHPPHACFFGFFSFALTSHAFPALQGVPVPSDLAGMEPSLGSCSDKHCWAVPA